MLRERPTFVIPPIDDPLLHCSVLFGATIYTNGRRSNLESQSMVMLVSEFGIEPRLDAKQSDLKRASLSKDSLWPPCLRSAVSKHHLLFRLLDIMHVLATRFQSEDVRLQAFLLIKRSTFLIYGMKFEHVKQRTTWSAQTKRAKFRRRMVSITSSIAGFSPYPRGTESSIYTLPCDPPARRYLATFSGRGTPVQAATVDSTR